MIFNPLNAAKFYTDFLSPASLKLWIYPPPGNHLKSVPLETKKIFSTSVHKREIADEADFDIKIEIDTQMTET